MKKIISYCLIAFLAILLIGCGEKEIEYTLSVSTVDEVILVDGTTMVVPSVTPTYEAPDFTFTSSNNAIATVDDTGLVLGIAPGTTDITVSLDKVGSKSITITVNPKPMTTAELKTLLTGRLAEFSTSLNGHVKIEAIKGSQNLTSELIYNYTEESIDSLMLKLSGSETAHVYIKEQFAYILRDQTKVKSDLTTAEISTIKAAYGFDKFTEAVAAFYNETAFYDALTFKSNLDGVITFELNLSGYTGEVFNTTGKNSIVVKAYVQNNVLQKVETVVVSATSTDSTVLHFLSKDAVTISYPTDLDTYPLEVK